METGLSGSNYNEVLQLIMNTNCNYAVGAALSAAGVVLLAAIWAVPALRKKSKKRRK